MREVSKDRLKAFLTLLPSIILIAIFVYGFIGNTVWTSFTDWGKEGALAEHPVKNFIGLQNYIDLFTGFLDGHFRQDLVNAVYYSVLLLVAPWVWACSSPFSWTASPGRRRFPDDFSLSHVPVFHRFGHHLALVAGPLKAA